jgi:hypothetical protein
MWWTTMKTEEEQPTVDLTKEESEEEAEDPGVQLTGCGAAPAEKL